MEPLYKGILIISSHNNYYNITNLNLQEDSIKLVLSHGLQCVVKGKLAEAEIIFSQALYLPDFQRVPIKAFVYICLAVIANKRVNQG